MPFLFKIRKKRILFFIAIFMGVVHLLSFYQIDKAAAYSHLQSRPDCLKSKNSVLITRNAKESTAWKMKLIGCAKKSIELSGCFCGGKVFDACLELIEQRLRLYPKLQVHILSMGDLITKKNRKLIERLQTEFSTQFHYLELQRRIQFFPQIQTFENHQKQLIVDGKYVVIGGTNFSDESNRKTSEIKAIEKLSFIEWLIGAGMNDVDAVVFGPLARLVRLDFYRLWEKWNFKESASQTPLNHFSFDDHPELIENEQNQPTFISEFDLDNWRVIYDVDMFFVSCGPEDAENNRCVNTLQKLFNEAHQTIYIAHMVFNEEKLIHCLHEATLRHVFVTVITNGNRPKETSLGKRALGAANRCNYSRLGDNWATFYEYDVPAEVYHKKVAIIDQEITVIGSMNISSKSVACDDESMLVIYSKDVAKIMQDILDEDITHSVKVSKKEIESYQKGWHWLIGNTVSWMNKHKMN